MKNLNDNNTLTIVIVLYKEPFELIYKTLNLIKDFKIIIIDNDNNNELKNKILNQFKIFKYICWLQSRYKRKFYFIYISFGT